MVSGTLGGQLCGVCSLVPQGMELRLPGLPQQTLHPLSYLRSTDLGVLLGAR